MSSGITREGCRRETKRRILQYQGLGLGGTPIIFAVILRINVFLSKN